MTSLVIIILQQIQMTLHVSSHQDVRLALAKQMGQVQSQITIQMMMTYVILMSLKVVLMQQHVIMMRVQLQIMLIAFVYFQLIQMTVLLVRENKMEQELLLTMMTMMMAIVIQVRAFLLKKFMVVQIHQHVMILLIQKQQRTIARVILLSTVVCVMEIMIVRSLFKMRFK